MEIAEILEQLEGLKQDIDEAKQEKAKYEGVLSEHFKTLKNLGVKSVAEGKKKIKVLTKEVEKLEETIQEQFATLQENYLS